MRALKSDGNPPLRPNGADASAECFSSRVQSWRRSEPRPIPHTLRFAQAVRQATKDQALTATPRQPEAPLRICSQPVPKNPEAPEAYPGYLEAILG